jgi:hypothetical protein
MAAITNTFITGDAIGIREDLTNVIYDISPTDTPFMSNIGRTKATNTLHEWQTDELDAVDTDNAVAEGDDVTSFDAVDPTVRMQNSVQISRKTVIIAGTMEKVDKAGRKSELAYQIAKRGKELKRDMESICLSNQAAVGSGVRKTGSLLAFVKTNTNFNAGGTPAGADPVYTTYPNATRTDSSAPRDFTETHLKDVVQQVYTQGGSPSLLMVGPVNKQKVSAFAGIAAQRYNAQGAKPSTIIGAADIYVSDFGNLSVVPNRFQRERDAHVIDPEYVDIMYLRSFRQEKLAKTGDAEKRMLLVEWGLKVKQEKALGLVADLTAT